MSHLPSSWAVQKLRPRRHVVGVFLVVHLHTRFLAYSTFAVDALSIFRMDTLPERIISLTDNLLVFLPFISPRSTKVAIERFSDVDTIPVEKNLAKFRSLGRVVEIQRIHIIFRYHREWTSVWVCTGIKDILRIKREWRKGRGRK